MPSSRGKALPLLKFLNSFYRYLPRTTTYLSFRARVHEWATMAFEISDKSSVNFRGDFPLMARLTWEDEEIEEEDVDMADAEEENEVTAKAKATDTKGEATGESSETALKNETGVSEAPKSAEEVPNNTAAEREHNQILAKPLIGSASKESFDLYSAFWSLQTFLTHPPSLADQTKSKATPDSPERTPFETFRVKTDFVLPHLYDAPRTEDAQIMLGKRLREDGDVEGEPLAKKGPSLAESASSIGELPRYLPKRRLFEYQVCCFYQRFSDESLPMSDSDVKSIFSTSS
jgi:THO complex subunit 1